MARKQIVNTNIVIDAELATVRFYSGATEQGGAGIDVVKSFSGVCFGEDFFAKFREMVREFAEANPFEGVRKVTVVVPDSAVLTDIIKVPTMKGAGQTKKALSSALEGLFKNVKELNISTRQIAQNKQFTTFLVAAIQRHLVTGIYSACAESKLLVDTLTYASSARAAGAIALDGSLKSAGYLLADLKDTYTAFTFVQAGIAIGHYTVPFGTKFVLDAGVTPEDMLFDHDYAELVVLNAREKARAKRLTIMEDEDVDAETVAGGVIGKRTDKAFKKAPRKLPKFMQRELPTTREGVICENFRVVAKWAMSVIAQNPTLTELTKPEFVCVNAPDELVSVASSFKAKLGETDMEFKALNQGAAGVDGRLALEICAELNAKAAGLVTKL